MQSYRPGHDLHVIHAKRIAKSPWGWRPGTVTAYVDGLVTVDYVFEDGTIELWHSRPVPVEPGTPVRVHERYYALEVAGAWFNVEVRRGGLGAVPDPDEPDLWAREVPIVVVDLARGVGLTGPAIEP